MAEKNNKEEKKPGFLSGLKRSVSDLRGELKKVVWPSKSQVINNTGIVLAMVILSSVVIGVFDLVLNTMRNILMGV
ncbi:MAG: preprotein translocase subunit SecE [Oscillospiraceae bacterium]|nr:preprotein translocase subunit SecE [Oscillospiraceae bacterium]